MVVNYIFDTNTVIYFLSNTSLNDNALEKLDKICAQGQHISIITKLELLGYNFSSFVNESLTKEFISKSTVYAINEQVEEETIKLRKSYKIKLPDAIIAATAIVNKLTLITRNTIDFKPIAELKTVNPFEW
ncbi:MAG: type II toxin-antitoxin system VapC family toxin [Candidatus Methylacidiphilales bacterium]